MVFRFGQNIQDDPARARDAHTGLSQFLFVIGLFVSFAHAVIMHLHAASCKFSQLEWSRSPQPILPLLFGALHRNTLLSTL
jgi:hypothetical protein